MNRMQLIDKNELVQEIMNNKTAFIGTHEQVESHDAMCDFAIDYITSAPVINVAPVVRGVVRCKDCIHKNKLGYCTLHVAEPEEYHKGYYCFNVCNEDFFCAYGERKER